MPVMDAPSIDGGHARLSVHRLCGSGVGVRKRSSKLSGNFAARFLLMDERHGEAAGVWGRLCLVGLPFVRQGFPSSVKGLPFVGEGKRSVACSGVPSKRGKLDWGVTVPTRVQILLYCDRIQNTQYTRKAMQPIIL